MLPAAKPGPPDPALAALLQDLLTRAAEAHGVYEIQELGGVYDTAWPRWYAQHMAHALKENGYILTRRDRSTTGSSLPAETRTSEQNT